MKVIVLCATKGGAGKTTLLHNLSVYAASTDGGSRGVLIADKDPQGSLSRLWDLRGELINPRLVKNLGDISESVAMLQSAGYDREFILIDTPGSLLPRIREAVAAADVIVAPTRPNPVDLRAQDDLLAILTEAGKLQKTLFVLTQTEKGDLLTKGMQYLEPHAKSAKTPLLLMPKRVEYPRAQEKGKAACEVNADAKKDIRKIWEEIARIAGRAEKRKGDTDVATIH